MHVPRLFGSNQTRQVDQAGRRSPNKLYLQQRSPLRRMKCLEILEFIKELCQRCCRNLRFQQQPQKDQLTQELVEIKSEPHLQTQQGTHPSNKPQQQLIKSLRIVEVTSEPEEKQEEKKVDLQGNEEQEGSFREEEFHSLSSHHSLQAEKGMGSSQRLITQLEKIKRNRKSSKNFQLRNSQSRYSSEASQNGLGQKLNLEDEALRFKEWLVSEFGKPKYVSFRISHAVRLRMHGQAMINHILHKLEDFKTNYLYESGEKAGYYFINKSKTLQAEFHHDQAGSYLQREKVTSYYKIKCFTNKLAPVLQILNSQRILRIMHSFSLARLVEYEGSLGINLPLLQVSQGAKQNRQPRTYHLAVQLGERISSEFGREVTETCFSLDEGEDSWQKVTKVVIGVGGSVEIYCQSYECINNDMEDYFQSKFQQLQKYLSGYRLIPEE